MIVSLSNGPDAELRGQHTSSRKALCDPHHGTNERCRAISRPSIKREREQQMNTDRDAQREIILLTDAELDAVAGGS
jgi:hypothetical protein